MEISSENLEQLYERLIRQRTYKGDTCPAEHVLVAHQAGLLPDPQRRLLENHFQECPSCKEDFIALERASQWFSANESQILAGLIDKATVAGLKPWATCPPAHLLQLCLDGNIPGSVGGMMLAAETRQHMDKCPECAKERERHLAAAEVPRVSLQDLRDAGAALLDRVRGFIEELVLTSQARGAPAFVRATPGYRSGELPSLIALVLGRDSNVLVDNQGNPHQCRFEVVQANIKPDGFITVELSTADRDYLAAPERQYHASLSISTDYLRLVLPEIPIDEQGRVTFTGMLPQAVAVDPLPLSALDVTVRQIPLAADADSAR